MRIKSKPYLYTLLFFLFSMALKAQENDNKRALSEVFVLLQNKYNYQFNYAKDLVENVKINPLPEGISLEETLAYIKKETDLQFTITQHFILVSKKANNTICGVLIDKENKLPLPYMDITSNGLKKSTISNANGFFQLESLNQLDSIKISGYGYKQITKPLDYFNATTKCDTIFLTPDIQSLKEVIISSYIVKGIDKLNNGSFKIDFSNFDILPGLIDSDVLQSVQVFPGIHSVNENVSNINIRGGSHDQNLILWDGIKMYQSGHFFGLISMYNPQITDNVLLVKNGSDASYTDGVSGSLIMQTHKELSKKFKGSIGINFTDANGFADIPISKKSSIQIAARKSISDIVQTPAYNSFFDRISQNTELENNEGDITNSNKAFDFYDMSLRWIYKINNTDELRINFINVSNELTFNESTTNDIRTSSLKQNSIAGAILYSKIWNKKWKSSLEVYETDYKLSAINADINDNQRFLQENIISETSLKLKVNYKLNDYLSLLNGYHFVETKVTNLDDVDSPRYRVLISEVIRTHGVFSQLNFKTLSGKTNLSTGIRINHIEKFNKQIVEPRLSLTHKFFNYFTVELLGEAKHQNISQIINFQNDFLGIEKRRWQLSNDDDIPIMKSQQASLGLSYNRNGWLVNLESYYKKVKGITTQSQGFQNQYEFMKTDGNYKVSGIDFILRKKIENLYAWVSYSHMDNVYNFESLPETEFPSNYNIQNALTFGTTYTLRKLKLSTGFNWYSGKPTTVPVDGNEIVNNEVNFESTNSSRLKNYFKIDASALYAFNLNKDTNANLGISVWNILNTSNELNRFYRIDDNATVNEFSQKSLDITPNFILRILF